MIKLSDIASKKLNTSMINTDSIRKNPYQPRKRFDEAALNELTDSIKCFGVLQPLLVRKIAGGYELIAGERRLRASINAGLKKVPCVITDMCDELSAAAALIENLQRRDLNCFEEAEAIKRLIDIYGYTQEEVAHRLGKSQPAVANKLRILRISSGLRKLIIDADLTERHARALLCLKDDSKMKLAIDKIIQGKLNVEQTEMMIKTLKRGEKNKSKNSVKLIFKDARIFTNTINSAVKLMKDSGINTVLRKRENDDAIIYLIKIPKKRNLS